MHCRPIRRDLFWSPTDTKAPAPSPSGYESLPAQVAARIRDEIAAGAWVDWLPGERAMAETLQVSRKTVRKALQMLGKSGLISTRRGRGHQTVTAGTRRSPASSAPRLSVGLLTLEPLERQRPYTVLWVDELRALLSAQGFRLMAFAGTRYYTASPNSALGALVGQNPQSCWVIANSTARLQRWFAARALLTVVAGSCHAGVPLSNVDLDYFGLCRHAAGALRRMGHRSAAILIEQSDRPGDLESERGFAAGMEPEFRPMILRHNGTPEGALRLLSRAFATAEPPTALLVANPAYYLTAFSFLAERGLRVPRDVSLISRDDDDFLSYLKPEPTRYSGNAHSQAKNLFRAIRKAVDGHGPGASMRIEPKLLTGASLGQVRADRSSAPPAKQ